MKPAHGREKVHKPEKKAAELLASIKHDAPLTPQNCDISHIASMTLRILSVHKRESAKIPVQLIALSQAFGFAVYQQDLPDALHAYLSVDLDNRERNRKLTSDKILTVNEQDPNKLKRLNIARCLAFYILGFDPNTDTSYSKSITDLDDGKASTLRDIVLRNRVEELATELLLPKAEFERESKRLAESDYSRYEKIYALSDKFMAPSKVVQQQLDKIRAAE